MNLKKGLLHRNEVDFITAELEEELVLINVQTSNYFGMDKTTTQIWNLLASPKTVHTLVTDLTYLYEVSPKQCEADILPVLENMVESTFLNVVAS